MIFPTYIVLKGTRERLTMTGETLEVRSDKRKPREDRHVQAQLLYIYIQFSKRSILAEMLEISKSGFGGLYNADPEGHNPRLEQTICQNDLYYYRNKLF